MKFKLKTIREEDGLREMGTEEMGLIHRQERIETVAEAVQATTTSMRRQRKTEVTEEIRETHVNVTVNVCICEHGRLLWQGFHPG